MVERKPLVMINGRPKQLPTGDSVPTVLPSPYCVKAIASGQSLISGFQTITLSSAPIGSSHYISTGLVCPRSGNYLVGYSVVMVSAVAVLHARLTHVGVGYYADQQSANALAVNGSELLSINSGQQIRLQVSHGFAGSRNLSSACLWMVEVL